MLGLSKRTLLLASLFTLLTVSSFAQSVTRIPGFTEPAWTAVDALHNVTYVANDSDPGTLSVIRNSAVLTNVAVGPHPLAVAVNLASHRIYVSSDDFYSGLATVWVLDGNTYAILAVVPISNGAALGVQGIAVDSARNRIYVTDGDNNKLLAIDGNTNQVVGSLAYGFRSPAGLGVNIVTHLVYVALNGSAVSVVDESTMSEVASVTVPFFAYQVAVNPVINRVYITCSQGSDPGSGGNLSIIDAKTNSLFKTVPTGTYPFGVDVNIFNGRVYVANNTDRTLGTYDANGNLLNTVAIGGVGPNYVAVNPVTKRIYVTDFTGGEVDVVRF